MKKPYIVGIGAANLDVSGRAACRARLRDSNPGHITLSAGGVTRNILDNYARMGGDCFLLGCLGNDGFGKMITDQCRHAGVNCDHVMTADTATSTYISILDNDGEMVEAVSDMRIMSGLSVDYIRDNDSIIRGSRMIVCDPSIPQPVMDYLLENYDNEICVDPVSRAYAAVLGERIGRFTMAKPNVLEAEVLSGCTIRNHDDLIHAAEVLIGKGLKKVFITVGKQGCLYYDRDGQLAQFRLPLEISVRNVTGAGDAFMAGAIHGCIEGKNPEDIIRMASAASWIALESEHTINPQMSMEAIERKLKEISYVI